MCLLTFIPEGVTPDMSHFAVAARNNPDGFGFAILSQGRILTGHGMNFEQVANHFADMRSRHDGHAIFHFRWATHGSTNLNNCHPFFLGDDSLSVVGHNGILPVKIPTGDVRSDTKVFAQDIMPAVGGITALDDDGYFKKLEDWAKGSKLVFLSANPDSKFDFYILNEQDGHWAEDMWWSNSSYKESRYLGSYGGWYMDSYARSTIYDWDGEAEFDKGETNLDNDEIDRLFEQFDVYTTHIDEDRSLIDCFCCRLQEMVPSTAIVTHCPSCTTCLHCGHWDCMCWDALYDNFDVEPYERVY